MRKDKFTYLLAMFIFGTCGIVAHYISLPSSIIVLFRALLGSITILLYSLIFLRKKLDFKAIKNNFLMLLLAGGSLAINWFCLFSGYQVSSVSLATLFNYLAPAIILLISPLIFKEKLTVKRIICALLSFLGMAFISGVFEEELKVTLKGTLLGLGSALCYVTLVIFNKKTKDIDVYSKCVTELFVAFLIMLPLSLLTNDISSLEFNNRNILLLLFIGIVHSGIAYIFYFGSMDNLSSQTISILSYVEPVISLLLSFLILKEDASIFTIIGAILILGSTLAFEINLKKPNVSQ